MGGGIMSTKFIVPPMYVMETICDNREKRQRSARRNFERNVYESIEHNDERFGEILDNELYILKQRSIYDRNLERY